MAHPHRQLIAWHAHAFEERQFRFDVYECRAVFALARGLNNAAEPGDHALLAIANPKYGHARREDRIGNLRRAWIEYARRAAGKNDAFGV